MAKAKAKKIEARIIEPKKIVFDFEVMKIVSEELAKELNESGKFVEIPHGLVIYLPEPYTWFFLETMIADYDEKEKALIISDEIPPGILPCNSAKYAVRIAKAIERRLDEIARTFEELRKKGKSEETKREVDKLEGEVWILMNVIYRLIGTVLEKRNTPIPPSIDDLESDYAKELGLSLKKMIEFAERPVSPSCNNNYTNVAKFAYKMLRRAEKLHRAMVKFLRTLKTEEEY